jgi:hypothetical protein
MCLDFFSYFDRTVVWTQGLTLAAQALYHLSNFASLCITFFFFFICFNFYLMFPNVKKKKSRFLHQLGGDHLKWDMQSSSVCTFLSFTFVALYNGVMDRKLDDMRLVGKCHLKNKNLQGSFYFATNLQSLLVFCFLLRRHMELKSFSCPILFNYLTNKHKL